MSRRSDTGLRLSVRSSTMRRPLRYVTTALARRSSDSASTSLIAACDTGDGRELSPPGVPAPDVDDRPDDRLRVARRGDGDDASPIAPFTMVAPWQDGAEIPVLNTCDGDDVSPALSWTGVPDGAVELALVVTDDDADGFVHWVVTSFDPAIGSMLEGQVPQGAVQWPNSFGGRRWNGPCPPAGSSHTYRFVLYALNQQVDEVTDDTPVDELLAVIDAFTLGSTTVTGTYTR